MAAGDERGAGQGGSDHRQAAPRPDGLGAAGLPGGVHALHGPRRGGLSAGALRVAGDLAAPSPGDRRPRLLVDTGALQENWRTLAALAPQARTGAAVKADAYGLGAARVGPALADCGCRDFFVAWASEGEALRRHLRRQRPDLSQDCRIFVLQGFHPADLPLLRENALVPVLSTAEDLALFLEATGAAGAPPMPAAIQLETGMNRLGLDAADAARAAEAVHEGRLDARLVMSHMSCADDPENPLNALQLARFREASALFPSRVPRSLANSAALFLGPDYAFDLTRPGIALYGGTPSPRAAGQLKPVATLLAAVLQLREAPAGALVGYGGAVELTRPTRIATLGIGYADGYPRAASGHGVPMAARPDRPTPRVYLAGHHAPILGRISMDLTLVDVSDVPEALVRPGTEAELFGANVPLDEVAAAAGTIGYEILCGTAT